MKKILSVLLICALVLSSASALAGKYDPNYTMSVEGTLLRDEADRGITPKTDLTRNPVIEGKSPTTGLPYDTSALYLPMLVQISNTKYTLKVNGKNATFAGIGQRAPWGGQYADIVYEGLLYRTGQTRITFLFNDSLADGEPTSVGPVRSARAGHVLLREEWGGGIVFGGGPKSEDNNIFDMFRDLGAYDKGVVLDLVLSNDYTDYSSRLKGIKDRSESLNVDLVAIRSSIPASTVATPHPFLFSDLSPYTEGYELAYTINLDWGHKQHVSHFYYDENNNLYLRYSGTAPYMTYASAERVEADMEQLSFNNVIVQRVVYEWASGSSIAPIMQNVGKGNADIFIGGRYIPGYWVRESIAEPTIYFDDQGNEPQLTPGKTFIAHLPVGAVLTYQGIQ